MITGVKRVRFRLCPVVVTSILFASQIVHGQPSRPARGEMIEVDHPDLYGSFLRFEAGFATWLEETKDQAKGRSALLEQLEGRRAFGPLKRRGNRRVGPGTAECPC